MTEDEIKEELLALARRHDIDVVNIDTRNDASPDVAFPFIRQIMMNPNFATGYHYVFRLAHEISHIIYGDAHALPYYRFSPLFLKTEEITANTQAIRVIARIVYRDVPVEQRNWVEFMDYLGLQTHFEPIVKRILFN
ncbi:MULTISPECIES: ImmA/IrrE family metallo-endopeptidase [Weissella]|uniref:ImmA/IrrE family metallo-endopeptidase n=1 Tax=Weissella TaxID=46255 RepID=UPI001D054514|nr:ImmA/IrrE family metallo-endopeptidase [Weissella cibaria]MCB5827545.1 ImmA/IrrE family metallo-endopeptidase [Weissella cibaria]MCB5858064.1 ImmA/IrrE family metallo-endopeptidase [Weissella cibaria]MCB5860290.1 ImmA/IrrE family metallo-endopeptidase [Weissella cibaria]MCB5862718.1 ImmA/IrrE family metallo-endopeptidase [Weissella cibaria]MCB5864807.1 ImmA/IrrE family metallo-endopeptidase [Weissella cibaria]